MLELDSPQATAPLTAYPSPAAAGEGRVCLQLRPSPL